MTQAFSPPGETAADLWLERSNFVGGQLESVFYGIHICVFFTALYFIVKSPPGSKRVGKPFIALLGALFALGTFQVAGNIKFDQMMWIDDRNIPGGPNAWVVQDYDNPVNTFQNCAYIIANFLADGSMIYRLFVVWGGNYYVIVIPLLAFLASTALSALAIFQAAKPGSSLWSHITVQFIVPYWSLSISLNVFITLMISFRLLRIRHSVRAALGSNHAQTYLSVVAMIVESAALFSITSLVFIICYARDSNVQNLVLPVLDQIVCIAPELIILRVAQGRAWTRQTSEQISTFLNPHGIGLAPVVEKHQSKVPSRASDTTLAASRSIYVSTSRSTLGSLPVKVVEETVVDNV